MKIRTALMLLVMMLPVWMPPTAMPADAEKTHQAGISAFKQGNYEEALKYFRQAESEGLKSPNLIYNLGVTYYRLERYKEAEQKFRSLADNHPEWRHLALYNLGRAAEARDDRGAAIDYYLQARRAAGKSKIMRLASRRIEGLSRERPTRTPGQLFAAASAAAGYDDNAVLAPDEGFGEISEEGDLFTELYGFGNIYVSGDENRGILLDGGAFARLYATENDYSYSRFSARISREKQYSPWHTSVGVSAAAEFAGSDLFSIAPALELSGERKLTDSLSLRLENTLSRIEGRGGYDYITGIENRLTARLIHRFSRGRFYAGMGLEYNDRDDMENQEGEFFSYSPLRSLVSSGMDWNLNPELTLVLYGQYRKSLYPDENRILDPDGSVIMEDKREDDRLLLSVRGEYGVSDAVDLFADYTRTDNDSNLPGYSYQSSRIMFGVRKIF